MNSLVKHNNEHHAALAFSRQAIIFDELYGDNATIQYKRERVRNHVLFFLEPSSRILELNSGTGEDAVFLAKQGHFIHATDISEDMQKELRIKADNSSFGRNISNELCSYTALSGLKKRGPYDMIFSNFGGLNCTNQLDKVLQSFDDLLRPGGIVSLVIISKFSLWEALLIFKGKFKTATRRFFGRKGRKAHIEGESFLCWYYPPSYVKKYLPGYEVLALEGLCTIMPPSYIEGFGEKYPRLFDFLKRMEEALKSRWPWKSIGDYYIISLKKKN
jgi:ubiquinone/menaquinone biosynthesis C-methylase UbiE